MEPFSIYCTTCQARLRVRKAAAIGTIVACPKCSAMVLVERPVAGAPTPDKAGKSTAASRSGASASNLASTPNGHSFEQVEDLLAGDDENHPAGVAAVAMPSPSTEPPAEHFDDAESVAEQVGDQPPHEPPSPEVDWTSSAILRWRPLMVAAGAGMLGVIGAVGVIRLLVAITVAQEPPVAVTSANETVSENAETDASIDPEGAGSIEADLPAPQSDTATTDPQVAFESGEQAAPNPVESAVELPSTDNTPKPRDRFGELVDLPDAATPDPPDETEPAELDEGVDSPPTEFESSSRIAVVNKGAPKPLDIVERMRRGIPAMELTQIPLYRFTDLVADYTAVPITLRWESIMQAGTRVGKTVDVDAQDTSIGQILQDVLKPLRLSVKRNGHHLEINKRRVKNGLRVTRYLVADLVNTESSIDDLALLVQQLVAPGTWKHQGGVGQLAEVDGRLAIKQRESAHFETLMLFEQLRIARNQRPLSSYPPELFRLVDRRHLLRDVLARPVQVRVRDTIRLTDLLRQIGDAAGCVVLPDWVAIAEAGWTPDTELQVASNEMSCEEMLSQLSGALDLTYRVLDSGTVEITTPSTERTRAEFSLHDIRSLRDAGFDVANLSERIQHAIGVEQFREVGGVIAIDAASDHVIVRLPQSLQVLVRDFLTTWGA